jgi:hypothetical protein
VFRSGGIDIPLDILICRMTFPEKPATFPDHALSPGGEYHEDLYHRLRRRDRNRGRRLLRASDLSGAIRNGLFDQLSKTMSGPSAFVLRNCFAAQPISEA